MKKDFSDLDLVAGIDTLQVKTSTFPEGEYPYFTHDRTRLVKKDLFDETEEYYLRVNPDKTYQDTSYYGGYQVAMNQIIKESGIGNVVKTRIDFRFDDYDTSYFDSYKLNKLLILLVAEHYNINNRYQSCDLLTAECKTVRVQNQYLELECYNKALEEPESSIKTRLEVRSKKLYDDTHEDTKELDELEKWMKRLEKVAANTSNAYTRLVNTLNNNLIVRYRELKSKGKVVSVNEFITKYEDFIFTRRQLTDLYNRLGYKSPEVQASKYKRTHKLECYSLKQIQDYVKAIRRSADRFINT